jgi:hypothetical protein
MPTVNDSKNGTSPDGAGRKEKMMETKRRAKNIQEFARAIFDAIVEVYSREYPVKAVIKTKAKPEEAITLKAPPSSCQNPPGL